MTITALSCFLATSAFARSGEPVNAAAVVKNRLVGKRPADKLLFADDAQRKNISESALAMSMRRYGARRSALRSSFIKEHNDKYTHALEQGPIRDQASSGRCWIFATLNVLEQDVKLRTGKAVKLSRAYIDAKNLQATAYEMVKSGANVAGLRSVEDNDISEGGLFGWATQIVDKFGVMPEHYMRDFADNKASSVAIKMLQTRVVAAQDKLRETGLNSPEAVAIASEAQKDIDTIIARAFTGKNAMPEKFLVDGVEYSPKTYAEHLGTKSSQYVTLKDQKALRTGWHKVGEGVHAYQAYNTGDVEIMKQAVRNAIDHGKKVYVAAPVGDAGSPYMSNAEAYGTLPAAKGIMSIAAHDYATIGLGHAITDRATVQRTGLNNANHAMTITGYDLGKDGKVIKWRVENSWGEKAADHGIQHMYDDFFTSFVSGVSVPATALPEGLLPKIKADFARRDAFAWELQK
ncbi:MAG: C1 family peptidase [Polyangia bacterium]